MATQKIDKLVIGKGTGITNLTSAQVFSSTGPVGLWDTLAQYGIDQVAEYSGKLYRALVNIPIGPNTAPNLDTASWEQFTTYVKDGDFAIIVSPVLLPSNSDLMIRRNGAWTSVIGALFTTTLPNNTAGNIMAQFPLLTSRSGDIEITIERGPNMRKSTLRFFSDGTNATLAEFATVDVGGGDIGVDFDVSTTGLNVQILSNTDDQPLYPINVRYSVVGWS